MKYSKKNTNIGVITIVENENCIEQILLGDYKVDGINEFTPLIRHAFNELDMYLARKIKKITVPYRLKGSKFEESVWQELLNIDYGELTTYKEVAIKLNKPNSMRAVGNACGKNKLGIIVPCHRVISSKGLLSGYAFGVEKKKLLLNLEGVSL